MRLLEVLKIFVLGVRAAVPLSATSLSPTQRPWPVTREQLIACDDDSEEMRGDGQGSWITSQPSTRFKAVLQSMRASTSPRLKNLLGPIGWHRSQESRTSLIHGSSHTPTSKSKCLTPVSTSPVRAAFRSPISSSQCITGPPLATLRSNRNVGDAGSALQAIGSPGAITGRQAGRSPLPVACWTRLQREGTYSLRTHP